MTSALVDGRLTFVVACADALAGLAGSVLVRGWSADVDLGNPFFRVRENHTLIF